MKFRTISVNTINTIIILEVDYCEIQILNYNHKNRKKKNLFFLYKVKFSIKI